MEIAPDEVDPVPAVRWDSDPNKWGKVQLWEYGRRKLGYGDYLYDPDHPVSYQKWSGIEAHKLHVTMKKRHITNREFCLAVDYCHARRMRIENPVWVFQSLTLAKAWDREQETTDVASNVANAVAYEQALQGPDSHIWIGRLTRAQGPFRMEVLEEWAQARKGYPNIEAATGQVGS